MHGRHPADVAVVLVLLHQQHRLGLVVQLRADMPSCVLVALVLVQYRVDVYLAVVRPLHQLGDDACGFAGAVDVVHHVADAVYHDKPQFRGVVDGLLHSRDAFFRGVLAKGEKFEVLAVPVGRQSRHAQDAFHHLETMIGALLGIDIENFPLVLGQFRRVQQYRAVLQRRRHDGGNVERLLAFRLADGRAEIAQRADDSSVRLQYLGSLFAFHADAQP